MVAGVRYEYLNNPNAARPERQQPLRQRPVHPERADSGRQEPVVAAHLASPTRRTRRPRSAWPRAGTGAARPASSGRSSSAPTASRACSTPVPRPVPQPRIRPIPIARTERRPATIPWRQAGAPTGIRRESLASTSPRYQPGTKGLPVFAVNPNYTDPHTDRITLGFEREIFQDTTSTLELYVRQGLQHGAADGRQPRL